MTRRRLLAAATAVAALAALVIAGLSSASSVSPPGASSPAASKDLSGSIVVIGTGGLSWSDVSAKATPALWSLLREGATATMSVRSVHANTCPVDGWLSLSAGERAGDVDPSGGGPGGGPDGAKPACQDLPDYMTAGRVPRWNDYLAAAAATRFDASLGLLGDQVASHGGCIQAVGPGAALGAARASGIVDRYQPYDESTLTAALASCPATLIDVGQIRDPADVDPHDASRPTTTRAQQAAAIDARVAAIVNAAPLGADVVLASLADAGVTERLRLIAATGPSFGAGTLWSRSTRQEGLVQLSDLTPTVLDHLGIPRPSGLGGAPLQFVPAGGNDEQSAAVRLVALLDFDESSHEVHSLVEPFFYGWALVQLALYLIAAVLWRRGRGIPPRRTSGTISRHGSKATPERRRLLTVTRQVATIAATVPVSTFLANLLPWWRFSVPLASVVASVAVFATAISLLALLGPWRQRFFGPLVVVCATTMAVLAADVMTGSRLQLSSLMGLQPVVGGRFYGMGNVTFAVFATATLMLCIAVGDHLVTVQQPRMAAAAVTVIGSVAIMVDAAPSWGSDFGGPPALLPALILLIMAILQIRPTWRRLLAVGGGTVLFVLVLGLLDWLRPPQSRSHLGRFVQTAIDGGAWDIIARKLDQNMSLLFGNSLSLLIPVGLVALAYILARPKSRAARPLRRSFERVRLLRPGLTAVLVMWVIGFALNDSGTAIPAVGAALAIPLVIAVALRTLEEEMSAGPVTTRASRRPR
ncbi:MAG: hypothetical protein ACYDDU_13255 [Dermatophilaceae bacterium]